MRRPPAVRANLERLPPPAVIRSGRSAEVGQGNRQAGDETELGCPRDRVAARRHTELAVDRYRLRLDRVARDVQPLGDLAEGEARREMGQKAQLGARERRGPALGDTRLRTRAAELDDLRVKRAQPRPPSEDRFGLADECRGAALVGQREPDPRELDPRLYGK